MGALCQRHDKTSWNKNLKSSEILDFRMERVEKESLLTIVIPTYNRASMLEECLSRVKILSDSLAFDLIVCNNASTDQTSEVLAKWELIIPRMRVVNHKENVFYDRNVASGYLQVKTDYCWLLGDSYTIDIISLKEIYETLLKKRPSAVVVNDSVDSLGGVYKEYTDANDVLRELGWYTTMLSSCIMRRDFISKDRCERYYDSGFIHEGVFYDYLASVESLIVLTLPKVQLSHLSIGKEEKAATGWMRTPFVVFGKRWYSFVMSLPYHYSIENKLHCIKAHDRHQHVFSPWVLFKNKLSGYTTFVDYKEARPFLKYIYDYPLLITDLISLVPSMPRLYSLVKKCIK